MSAPRAARSRGSRRLIRGGMVAGIKLQASVRDHDDTFRAKAPPDHVRPTGPTPLRGQLSTPKHSPIDDLEGWGFDSEQFWGTLRTASGAERVPSEQGRYHDYYEAFARAVHEGAPPPVTAEEAVRTLAVLDAARASAADGRRIELGAVVD